MPRRPPSPPAAGQTLVQEYEAQKQLLLTFASELEGEFLGLGTRLGEVLRQAKALKHECGAVDDLLAGQGEDPAIQFSFQLLKKAEDLVLASYDQYACVFKVFKHLTSGLKDIESRQDQLCRALRPLPLVTIQFRIQAGVFDDTTRAAFLNLSGELNMLLREVHAAVERQFQDLAQVQATSSRLTAELSEIIALHQGKISQTLQGCRGELAALGQALQQCDEAVRSLSGQSSGIQTGVNRVIMALQCQDITYQKLQHVGQAIDEMIRHLREAAPSARRGETGGELADFLARANAIQSSQVEAVFSQLREAARQMTQGIQLVESQAKLLSEQAVAVGAKAVRADVMARSVQGMQDILAIVAASVRNVHKVGAALEPLKAKFTQCTEQISSLANRVRLAALNAQVYAAGLQQGAALEVLAEQTRGISGLVLGEVDTITGQLRDLGAAIENLFARLADFHQLGRREQDLLVQEAKLAESKLERVRQDLPRHLAAIPPRQQALTKLTQEIVAGLSFPARITGVSASVLEFFQSQAQRAASAPVPSDGGQLTEQRLDQLRQNYTMEHERQVHDQAKTQAPTPGPREEKASDPPVAPAGLNPALPAPAQPGSPVRPGADLGVNVELF